MGCWNPVRFSSPSAKRGRGQTDPRSSAKDPSRRMASANSHHRPLARSLRPSGGSEQGGAWPDGQGQALRRKYAEARIGLQAPPHAAVPDRCSQPFLKPAWRSTPVASMHSRRAHGGPAECLARAMASTGTTRSTRSGLAARRRAAQSRTAPPQPSRRGASQPAGASVPWANTSRRRSAA